MEEKVNTVPVGKEIPSENFEMKFNALLEQYKELFARYQEANLINAFKRLDYLFKITDNTLVFTDKLVEKAINEIDSMLFPKEDTSEE